MSSESSKKSVDETTESWRVTGEELMEFVLKTSESLHNVINRARLESTQTSGRKRRSAKRKRQQKRDDNDLKKSRFASNTEPKVETYVTSVEPQLSFDYDFDWTSSSCEELNDIPMEELLSSPTWKQIVRQNEFVWP